MLKHYSEAVQTARRGSLYTAVACS